jgi:hypothetical protein
VGIWNRVLREDEIAYLAEGNAIPEPDQVVAPVSLNITRVQVSEDKFQIIWEGGEPPFQVQSRTAFGDGSWKSVGAATNDTTFETPIIDQKAFFRVVQPE